MKGYAKRKPQGSAKFEPIRAVRYLDDEDVFEVEFDSGETFQIPHAAIRRANGLGGQLKWIRCGSMPKCARAF